MDEAWRDEEGGRTSFSPCSSLHTLPLSLSLLHAVVLCTDCECYRVLCACLCFNATLFSEIWG